MGIKTINPATEAQIQIHKEMSAETIAHIIQKTHEAFEEWRHTSFSGRSTKMKRAGEILRKQKELLSVLMAKEMGKPLPQGQAEIEKCAWACDYFAEHAEQFLSPQEIQTDAAKSAVIFQPLGIVFAVMPWNFPFWQVFRFAAPNLMAGNAALLKHSPNTTGCAIEIEKLVNEAGFPENLLRTLIISENAAESVIENTLVKGVTLTGSTRAGRAVAAKAGACLKKTVLELGGSDPYIVLEDADLEQTVETCVASRLVNSGQSCIAAKRFIVVEPVVIPFTELVVEKMKTKTFGDPLTGSFDIGPMARSDLRDNLHKQVKKSINEGAKLLLGGTIPKGKGFFYPPTVLSNVKKGMPAFDEETFGPVAAIISTRDESHAIRLANDSLYGLGAAMFTRDLQRAERIAKELETGTCFINDFVRSDPRLPFGGIKDSGYGRELSVFGIHEFVNIKTVVVK